MLANGVAEHGLAPAEATLGLVCCAAALTMLFARVNWCCTVLDPCRLSLIVRATADSPGESAAGVSKPLQAKNRRVVKSPLAVQLDGERVAKVCVAKLRCDGEDVSTNVAGGHCLLLAQVLLRGDAFDPIVFSGIAKSPVAKDLKQFDQQCHVVAAWWTARCSSLQQRVLEQPASTLDQVTTDHYSVVLKDFDTMREQALDSTVINLSDIETLANLEKAVYAFYIGDAVQLRTQLQCAGDSARLKFELSGMLVRTAAVPTLNLLAPFFPVEGLYQSGERIKVERVGAAADDTLAHARR